MRVAPAATEYVEYYQTYVGKVPDGDIRDTLRSQRDAALDLLHGVPPGLAGRRYAPGKWSMREALNHINDTERVFTFRAWWFARGLPEPLPSFDQDRAVAESGAEDRGWDELVEEFAAIRAVTLHLFETLPSAAWDRAGVASGNHFTVRALAWITAGHVEHHLRILSERYLAA